MTLRDAGDVVIWIGAICGALVAILALVHVVAVKPARRWLADQMSQLNHAQRETTSSSETVATYVDRTNKTLAGIREELHQTNKLALQNQVQILETARRLDQHLIDQHT